MLNLIKYEIKGSTKFIAVVVITLTLLSLFAFLTADVDTVGRTMFLMVLGAFGGNVAILYYFVTSFSKEVYEDRGYLTLTLPVSGNSIVLSKLIVTTFWYTLYSVIQLGFIYLIFSKYSGLIDQPILTTILKDINKIILTPEFLAISILGILQSIGFVMTVYFSIAISKAALGVKKIGKLIAFIVFIAITSATTYIDYLINSFLPFNININSQALQENLTFNNVNMQIENTANAFSVNVPSVIFTIILFFVFLYSTGYILEKKIDL
ncbi:hypothetical protein [Senegalia sp. (in: firmicutes)]|uniref:hypothetical protein n=1 Tax=Senegalia sp. (in: firmicutes) TaxID=1924098 RepID=UPI003F9D5CAD